MKFKSSYIAFSAPSGTGKTTIVEYLVKKYPHLVTSVSATTRPKRPGEIDGIAYHFLSERQFEEYINKGAFLEYEKVHGNYYGTLKATVDKHISDRRTVLFDIDVNGALSIKNKIPAAILIFLKPPYKDELITRLKNRKSETMESIDKRLQRLSYEYEMSAKFDYVVINDKLEDAIKEIERIIID
ncbi:MAG: guanylate kinase [Calditrichaceae bacterium]|nr:guanylate kinase [Calditrichaceae bacterium]MBN2709924.1 guanylate kinase [Calditrichaceae bacterium]RQV92708.1 MAG: guanylate kinase [Calditrichota bacterium]